MLAVFGNGRSLPQGSLSLGRSVPNCFSVERRCFVVGRLLFERRVFEDCRGGLTISTGLVSLASGGMLGFLMISRGAIIAGLVGVMD